LSPFNNRESACRLTVIERAQSFKYTNGFYTGFYTIDIQKEG